jgi:uncharacterized damage-inducible protein DinB
MSPPGLSVLVSQSLSQEYDLIRRKIRTLVEPLSNEHLWQRPFPYGNSVGHLLLHLTGNLSYYIGAQIARTGYIRDRPKEFADTSNRPKEDVLKAFDHAVDLVISTLEAQGEADWQASYEATGFGDAKNRLRIFVHCAAHLDHHAGQIIYLCKQMSHRP